jgi:hypothetical protein
LVVTLASLTPELGQAGPDPQRQGAESNDPKIQDAGRRSSPGIEFAATAFDFGKILSGLPIKHEFVFTNTGTVPLEITEVKPGCGCTTAGAWDRIVNPGRTGKIPLQLNLAAFSGPFAKSATVTCNDPTQTNVVLQLLGTVWKPIEIIPPTAVFTVSTEAPTNETKVLRILSNFSEPIVLSDVQCTNDAFRAELKTVQPGKEFELHITVAPPLSSASAFTAVMMKTSSSQIPQISASIYATLQPVLTMTPQQIALPPVPLTNGVTAGITIHNYGTNLLELSEARVDAPDVEVRVREPQPGRLFTLTVSFPAGFKIPSEKQLELSFKSNHPKFPLIKVPIFQSAPSIAPVVLSPVAAVPRSISPSTRVVPTRVTAPLSAAK